MTPDRQNESWVSDDNVALLTDLYQLTMMQVYFRKGMSEKAVFDLYVRNLPESRKILIACGLEDVLHFLESLHFSDKHLHYLSTLGLFSHDFLDYLADFSFSGDVWAVPEGTPVFGYEPILQIEAPLPEAQLVETFLLNQINFQTGIASKTMRVVQSAQGRTIIDFGLRRTHGTDAGMKAARASWIAGVSGTSNVLAGHAYGIPVFGTMAHSFIEAHDSELEAFEDFARVYPHTTLLIDTYNTLEGIRNVIRLAEKMGDRFTVRALRLDSGNLAELSKKARQLLDDADLRQIRLFASGNLDEYRIRELMLEEAPIDGFGVGTAMGSLADASYLSSVYKLSMYDGRGRMKFSTDKASYPGRKQLFRQIHDDGTFFDTIGLRDESLPGIPLLKPAMLAGNRMPESFVSLKNIRAFAAENVASLPEKIRSIEPDDSPVQILISPDLKELTHNVRRKIEGNLPSNR